MTTWTGTIPTIASGDTTTVPTDLATYRDALKAISEAWTAYTPTWTGTTNPAIGNGSFSGSAYLQVNKLVIFRIVITMGTTTTYGSGSWFLTVPVAPKNAGRVSCWLDILDNGTANYSGRLLMASGSTTAQLLVPGTTAGGAERAVGPTVPHAWGSTDQLTVNGEYEAA